MGREDVKSSPTQVPSHSDAAATGTSSAAEEAKALAQAGEHVVAVLPDGSVPAVEQHHVESAMPAVDADVHTVVNEFTAPEAVLKPPPYTYLREEVDTMQRRRNLFGALSLLVVLLVIGFVAAEVVAMSTRHAAFFNDQELSSLNDVSRISHYFGTSRLTTNRLLWVFTDGMRYEALQSNDRLRTLLNRPDVKRDSVVFPLRTQLPSMSFPNYLSLCSGASPSMHGQLGNLWLTGPTPFDTVFRRCTTMTPNSGSCRASTSDGTYLTQILSSDLTPPLPNDTVIHEDRGPTGETLRHDSMNKKDEWWAGRVYDMLNLPEDQRHDLFLAFFADIDARGHQHGAASWFYDSAVTNKTIIVENIMSMLDNRTILLWTSDHGMVDVGGHGGAAPIVMTVPVWIYKNGSGVGEAPQGDWPSFGRPDHTWDSLDLTASISAILGLPVSRESEGVFLDQTFLFANQSVMDAHYRDLWLQKQSYVEQFLKTARVSYDKDPFDPNLQPPADGTPAERLVWFRDQTVNLMGVLEDGRAQTLGNYVTRNEIVSVAVSLVLSGLFLTLMHKTTFADIVALSCCCDRRKYPAVASQANCLSLLSAIGFFGIYAALTVPTFFITYRFYRSDPEWRWDITLWNSVYDGIIYVLILVMPAVIVLLITTIILMWYIRRATGDVLTARLSQSLMTFNYLALVSDLFAFWFLAAQALHCVYIPYILPMYFITETNWTQRFQSCGVACIFLPLMIWSCTGQLVATRWVFDSRLHPASLCVCCPTSSCTCCGEQPSTSAPDHAVVVDRKVVVAVKADGSNALASAALDWLMKLKLRLILHYPDRGSNPQLRSPLMPGSGPHPGPELPPELQTGNADGLPYPPPDEENPPHSETPSQALMPPAAQADEALVYEALPPYQSSPALQQRGSQSVRIPTPPTVMVQGAKRAAHSAAQPSTQSASAAQPHRPPIIY